MNCHQSSLLLETTIIRLPEILRGWICGCVSGMESIIIGREMKVGGFNRVKQLEKEVAHLIQQLEISKNQASSSLASLSVDTDVTKKGKVIQDDDEMDVGKDEYDSSFAIFKAWFKDEVELKRKMLEEPFEVRSEVDIENEESKVVFIDEAANISALIISPERPLQSNMKDDSIMFWEHILGTERFIFIMVYATESHLSAKFTRMVGDYCSDLDAKNWNNEDEVEAPTVSNVESTHANEASEMKDLRKIQKEQADKMILEQQLILSLAKLKESQVRIRYEDEDAELAKKIQKEFDKEVYEEERKRKVELEQQKAAENLKAKEKSQKKRAFRNREVNDRDNMFNYLKSRWYNGKSVGPMNFINLQAKYFEEKKGKERWRMRMELNPESVKVVDAKPIFKFRPITKWKYNSNTNVFNATKRYMQNINEGRQNLNLDP
ncbi:hypothetical protein L1987_16203 [Smallanthus sonchifolius]|uniref:Uncharacterized protein n=1 Tax=Smallanthus sonchifolius TaxID=185202 RepID=A0ACB9J7K5_9ASTR|nr:hypothetical protein L1987_16203 [Smallanthus sonchifolius]